MPTLADLATALNAPFFGDGAFRIEGAAEPQDAKSNDIAIATGAKFAARLPEGAAQVALLSVDSDWQALGLKGAITVARPKLGMAGVCRSLDGHWRTKAAGIHPTAIIDPSAQIARNASIGAYVCIGANTKIGPDAILGNHVTIGEGCVLGAAATVFEKVSITHNVQIGDNFIAHPGVVIGGDGFSYVTPEQSGVERARDTLGDQGELSAQAWVRVHSLGSVRIGNDVELGSNVCVDRGTIRDTVIGNGVKVDNLAQIGHNVTIGNDTLVCAQVGIAGSSRIGNNVVLGGQTGVSDNVFVGDNAITGGATKVLSNVPAGRVMLGYPAVKMDQQLEIHRALRRLPKALVDLASLKKAVFKKD